MGFFSALVLAELTCAFETSMVVSSLPAWSRIVGNPAYAGWLVTSYLLIAAGSAGLVGRLGDLYGRERALLCTLGCCVVGSAISAFGPSFAWVLAGRAIQGVSGAIVPLVYALIREQIEARRIPVAVSVMVATTSIGGAFGLLTGGYIVDTYGPQEIFLLSMGLGALSMALFAIFRPASTPVSRQSAMPDYAGALLLVVSSVGTLLAITAIRANGPFSFWSIAMTVLAIGAVLLLIWQERRHRDPLIDLDLLTSREIKLVNLAMCALSAGVFQIMVLTSFVVQQPRIDGVGLGLGATIVGILKFPALIGGVVASSLAGYASLRWGCRATLVAAAALCAFGLTAALWLWSSLIGVLIVVVLCNCGLAAAFAAAATSIIQQSPPDRVGEATGMMTVFKHVFAGIGAQIVTGLLTYASAHHASGAVYASAAGLRAATLFMVISSVAALVLAIFMRRTAKPSDL